MRHTRALVLPESKQQPTQLYLKMAAVNVEVTLDGKACSPMVPFKNGLRILKYVGLPLEFNHDATQCADKGRMWKCILLPGSESVND